MHARVTSPPQGAPERGGAVADVLAGAWRPMPPPLAAGAEALAAAIPLLLQSTAAPLAWRRLRAAGRHTDRAARPLQRAYREHAVEAAGHEQQLQRVVPLLRAAGVEPILIKGWSIARLYPESGLRPYCDLDLSVRPDRLDAVMSVLDRTPRWEQVVVELHRGIPDLRDRTWDDVYRRSRLARLGDVEVRLLGPEDQLRLLCFHQMRHGCFAPLCLCDLAVALESRPADFDWDYCLHGPRARADWVRCWLGLAGRLLGARLDEPALAAWSNGLPPWLAPTVLARWARPVHESHWLDPIKSAYRRGLRPCHSLPTIQLLGALGRVAEVPSRLWRQCRRWRRPRGRPFVVHDEAGA
jgi:hypothetical protein